MGLYPVSGTRDERSEVETVGRTGSELVGLQPSRRSLDQSPGSDGVAALVVGQAHTQLSQPLPELAFLLRARLPPDLESLVGGEGAAVVEQTARKRQGLVGRKRFL
jgi:hypothetical protein